MELRLYISVCEISVWEVGNIGSNPIFGSLVRPLSGHLNFDSDFKRLMYTSAKPT